MLRRPGDPLSLLMTYLLHLHEEQDPDTDGNAGGDANHIEGRKDPAARLVKDAFTEDIQEELRERRRVKGVFGFVSITRNPPTPRQAVGGFLLPLIPLLATTTITADILFFTTMFIIMISTPPP